jgi:ribonucleoside-diphosphate reductase alpha chain
MSETVEEYLGIKIDRTRDALFDKLGLTRLKESYMLEEESSPQERFAFVSKKFSSNPEHAQRLYDYASKHWLSYSTPILSFGRTKKGLPISCFLNFIPDTAEGLVDSLSESNWLSMMGGGVGLGVGMRSSSDKSTGVMAHMKTYDSCSLAYRQGTTRRGSYAAYLDISHPDIINFMEMRKPTGDPNIRCLNMHNAVMIPDSFMKIIEKCMIDPNYDDSWPLIDNNTKEVKEVVSAKYLWQLLLDLRMMTGEPYIMFKDTANNAMPKEQYNKGLRINQSNICTEITLATDANRTAVCCLSSINVYYFDQYKNIFKQLVDDVAEMLDNVLTYFIENAPDSISRARYSATMERAIGIGTLGFHSYLQHKRISFESVAAKSFNRLFFKKLKSYADESNLRLGSERGEAPDMVGSGKRFSCTIAVAPNATSSIIMGNISPSVEPLRANVFRQDTLSGSFIHKNKELEKLLYSKEIKDIDEVWNTIISNDGSVQHLDILTEEERDIFKTAIELDQRWIIEHAGDRQEYIDQAQSINLFFKPDVDIKYLHAVHFLAWKKNLKTLYYCRSEKIKKANKISQRIERKRIEEIDIKSLVDGESCIACE